MGRMFDNVMKILSIRSLFTGATLVSVEADFELPRGFIAKIHDVEMEAEGLFEDFEGISADKHATFKMCLLKDPDDTTTIEFTSNRVDHDVLMVNRGSVLIVANAADTSLSMAFHGVRKERNYTAEGLDVFTARNMRFNIDAFGTDAADMTETIAVCDVHYTLEKITSEDIINLLDIL